MNPILLFLVGGWGFWLACALLLLGPAFSVSARRPLRWSSLLVGLMGIATLIAATEPLPLVLFYLWIGATALWLVIACRTTATRRARVGFAALAMAVALASAAMMLPWHLSPSPPSGRQTRLYVIGDSISAGIGQGDISTWPRLLREQHAIEVVDLSRAGSTLGNALARTEGMQFADGIILIEIGGNDIIGSRTTDPVKFELQLDTLLQRLAAPGQTVLMFELPLTPGQSEFGRIQRRQSAIHGAILIPKRYFTSMLRPGMTLDGIHLTQAGHRHMADVVWQIVGPGMTMVR